MTTLFISHSAKEKEWAEQIHTALSGEGYQSLFLDSHPDQGVHAGADWERTLYQRLRQSRGVVVLCTANWLASPWCVAEAMMARERGKPLFMLVSADVAHGHQIPDFLKNRQSISLTDMTMEEAYGRLWRGLAEAGLRDDFPLPKRPYPGLDAFQESDAAIFFGRDDAIARVREVLNRRHRNNARGFMVVLGASGCGKSSLVRAGVLPRLRRASGENVPAEGWGIPQPFTAGKGLEGLALSLAQAFKEAGQPRELASIRPQLEAVSDMRALAGELLLSRSMPAGFILLVLDQLEEVFGTPEGSGARALLRLLLESSADAGSPVVVLATMRSDFLNDFQMFEGAAERYVGIPLDPMPKARFGEIIEGPADRFGLRLEGGFSKRLVEDAGYSDALPLLAFTLERLYTECGADGELTLREYEKLFPEVQVQDQSGTMVSYSGVSAAIKHVANEVLKDTGYAGLPEDDARMRDLRRAFYSLARVEEESQFTRRTARWSQMPGSCTNVLQRFVKDRLLVSGKDDNGQPILSVAHEALFRVWDRLHGWLVQDRKALALRSQIEDAAAEWTAENRAESRAWPEERILDAVRQIEKSGVAIADVENRATVDAFLGPTDPKILEALPALTAADDATAGSGRYGEAWRLPLGHLARASTGERLALLGDHRKGVGLRADGLPDIDWLPIDTGDVTIEIRFNPNDPNSEVVKRLTRTVERFWMARYPVTIVQFQAFLDECYRDGAWQLPDGFLDLPATYSPPKHRARHGNHPADTVNWYDAAAFCHWLNALWNSGVRLPTEGSGSSLLPAATREGPTPGVLSGMRKWSPGGRIRLRAGSAALRPWVCIRGAPHRRVSRTWRAPSGSGAGMTSTIRITSGFASPPKTVVCCAAGRGASVTTTRAPPSASGTSRASGSSASVSVWCVRPHL